VKYTQNTTCPPKQQRKELREVVPQKHQIFRAGGVRSVTRRQLSNPNIDMSKQMLIIFCDSAEKNIAFSMRLNSYLYSPPNVIECLMRGETKPREAYRAQAWRNIAAFETSFERTV
jgi:hypothetical protein